MTDLDNQSPVIPQYDDTHYAVVDLGSNSFHLLITQLISTPSGKAITTVNKVKQKVRLAAGLDKQNILSDEAMNRGLNCLKHFALYLNTIPVNNIAIVATAALRIAKNNEIFFDAANKLLPKKINLLSGEQEAAIIYAGVNHTAPPNSQLYVAKQLVLDIGGASTEIIIGSGCDTKKVVSLDIGCVSFIKKYFADGLLTQQNFEQCTAESAEAINTVKAAFLQLGWQSAVSSSGTMQGIIEILTERQQEPIITLPLLNEIKQLLIASKSIDNIEIAGLREDRKAVLASGLSILIALFKCLNIDTLCLSSGALREGLLSELAPDAKII